MGRFSPTVAPVADTGLADALGAFTQTYMQASNRKREREQQDRQLDVEMLHSGYRPQTDDEIAQALANQPQPLVPGGQPHRMPGMQISDPAGRASLAHALSMDESGNELVPQQGTPPVKIGKKGYVETDQSRETREAKRAQAALAARLGEAQIGNYQSEAEKRRWDMAHPKPVGPVPGSAEWMAMKVQEAKIANQYGYHAPPTQFSFGTTVDPTTGQPVVLRQNTKTGEVTPTDAGKPATGGQGGRGSATIQKAIAENKTNMTVIDDAMKELDAHPEAVGLSRGAADLPLIGGFGDAINQRQDPAGVAARASLSNVSSLVIKDRSGSAVSVSESARLRPFIPSVGDTPDAIRTKLRKLKAAIQTETDLLSQGGGGSARQPSAPTHESQAGSDATPHKRTAAEILAAHGIK